MNGASRFQSGDDDVMGANKFLLRGRTKALSVWLNVHEQYPRGPSKPE